LKQIPDADHPYKAPGPKDQRGPCPGLNTLANHGYIPRNGIASLEQIINGTRDGYNMDYGLASALTSFGMLARGNAFIDLLSIGGPVPEIPALPGKIDGPVAGGLATHGRFEGDVSMTRQDAAIGDNRHFQVDLYDELLVTLGQFGDNSPVTGNNTVFNNRTMAEFKYRRFVEDQKANKVLQYHAGRYGLSYGETAFALLFFANGTDGVLTDQIMGSFFRNQTFPENWHRRGTAGTLNQVIEYLGVISQVHPEIVPGANDEQGVFKPDDPTAEPCPLYTNLAADNLPAVLFNTTGILKNNVDTLLQQIYLPFQSPDCPFAPPRAAAEV